MSVVSFLVKVATYSRCNFQQWALPMMLTIKFSKIFWKTFKSYSEKFVDNFFSVPKIWFFKNKINPTDASITGVQTTPLVCKFQKICISRFAKFILEYLSYILKVNKSEQISVHRLTISSKIIMRLFF